MVERDPSENKKSKALRATAANSITTLRTLERELGERVYEYSRDAAEYIEELCGLENLFQYALTLPSHTVLDAGAGTLKGVNGLSLSRIGHGLTFKATILHRPPETIKTDRVTTYRTPIETFRGVPDSSVGCIMANYSLAYAEPQLAIASCDRVLVPGGAIKATFAEKGDAQTRRGVTFKETKDFSELLRGRGYDVHEEPHLPGRGLILAIKPGGSGLITASELFWRDEQTARVQIDEVQIGK